MKQTVIMAASVCLVLAVSIFFLIRGGRQQYSQEDGQSPKIYHLSFAHDITEDSAIHQGALRFANLVKERSQGQVLIDIYPKQQLGNDHQMVEKARSGEIDIVLTPTAKLGIIVPQMQYADLPFLFRTREDAHTLLDGEVGQILFRYLEPTGLQGVTFWENGFKHFTANRPITKPADFQGLKIRTMQSRIIMDQFQTMGATPIPIDFHFTYDALRDGVVDGQENPLVSIVAMKFYEVQPYLTLSKHAYLGYVLSISQKTLTRLPENMRQLLFDAAKEVTPWERAETLKREKSLLKTIRESGTEVITLSEKERKSFEDATRTVAFKFRDIIGHEIMSATEQYLQQKYGLQDETDILIGLNADMSLANAQAGLAIKRGLEMAIDEINAQGGVLGRKVALMVLDHKANPARGRDNFKKLSHIPQIVAIIAGMDSPVTIFEARLAQKLKTPLLVPWAAATDIVNSKQVDNFVFRLSIRDEFAGLFLADKARKISRKIGLLLEKTAWGRSNEKAIKDALLLHNIYPVATAWFFRGDTDIHLQLEQMEDAGAEVIILVANSEEGVHVVKGMARQKRKIPIIAHWGITGGYFWDQTKNDLKDLDFTFIQTNWFLDKKRPEHRQFMETYTKKYGQSSNRQLISPSGTIHAYDLMHLLALAIQQAGEINRTSIRQQLEKISSHKGIFKFYTPPFSPKNHEALSIEDYLLATFDAQGRIIPVSEN